MEEIKEEKKEEEEKKQDDLWDLFSKWLTEKTKEKEKKIVEVL